MPTTLYFLSGAVPLTKTITKKNGKITKSAYPHLAKFTSHKVTVNTLRDFYQELTTQALSKTKPCLIKGTLKHDLQDESRKNSTQTNDKTTWLCLDLDDAEFTTHEEFMHAIKLDDYSYIWQASSSFGLEKKKTLSGHIFILLNKPIAAPIIKAWLMGLNFETPSLDKSIRLSPSGAALHYPLDITTCQNDKLLYIAEPIFEGLPSPIKSTQRFEYVRKTYDELNIDQLKHHHMDKLRKLAADKRNKLRTEAGMTPIKAKTTVVGEYEVQRGVGAVAQFEQIDCGDYYRYNLNGGDSQAYWHPKTDLTYLHSFKGEPSMLLKEILPDVYKELTSSRYEDNRTPITDKDGSDIKILAFREKRSADYWKGTWNPTTQHLDIHKVKNETQLAHYLMGHGLQPPPYVPEWEMIFDPRDNNVVDEDTHIINTFTPPPLTQLSNPAVTKGPTPLIDRILESAVAPKTHPVYDHFINWLACIVQYRIKTKTAWVLHGEQGTGKGLLVSYVIASILDGYVGQIRASTLKSEFNGWQERRLVMAVDEIDENIFFDKKTVESDLLNYITDPHDKIRRMRVDEYMVPSFLNYIFMSNKPVPVRIPMGDRRFNVGVFQPKRLHMTHAQVEQELPKEYGHFAHMLLNYKADINRAGTILQHEDRERIQELNMNSTDIVAQALIKGDLGTLFEALPDQVFNRQTGLGNELDDAFVMLMEGALKDALARQPTKFTRDQLKLLFEYCAGIKPMSPHKFTSFLRHKGIEIAVLKIGNKTMRGYSTGWKNKPEQIRELQSLINKPDKAIRRVK